MVSSFDQPAAANVKTETHGQMSRRPLRFNARKIIFD